MDDDVEEVTYEEGRRMLDKSARRNLNMTGDEFLTAWDEGRIFNTDTLAVQQVASLISFSRNSEVAAKAAQVDGLHDEDWDEF